MFEMRYLTDKLITLRGNPIVKKNNQQVVNITRTINGVKVPSKTKIDTPAYKKWVNKASADIAHYGMPDPIDFPVNAQMRFFLDHDYKVDLSALYEGVQDLLVSAGVLQDDNWKIISSHNGSGIEIDPGNPRVEILLTKKYD